MIQIEKVGVYGWQVALRGMRNPFDSHYKSDSRWFLGKIPSEEYEYIEFEGEFDFYIGPNDLALMQTLCRAGTDHRKFLRMINVTADITAPLYWWKEYDTYKVGTVANSCSTMHMIHAKEFTIDDFSHEHLDTYAMKLLRETVDTLNRYRELYVNYDSESFEVKGCPSKKMIWWQLVQLLPSSYNQRRTIQVNYEVLLNMYHARKAHKLDEWVQFCEYIKSLPCFAKICLTEVE